MKISIGKLHHIGQRQSQQDSFGIVTLSDDNILCVVADGMGGLSDGDKVSQCIVYTMLSQAKNILREDVPAPLYQLAGLANAAVNMDSEITAQSGSTLLAVWQKQNGFQWIAVGDSRIYLYRAGSLIQMNSEHIYQKELLLSAVNGEISYEEAWADTQAGCLVSYVGMGRLRYIDGSLHDVPLEPGDRILLMSDGVFNTLSEKEIAEILMRAGEVERAAKVMQEEILKKNRMTQDNFTAVILGWDYEGM